MAQEVWFNPWVNIYGKYGKEINFKREKISTKTLDN